MTISEAEGEWEEFIPDAAVIKCRLHLLMPMKVIVQMIVSGKKLCGGLKVEDITSLSIEIKMD